MLANPTSGLTLFKLLNSGFRPGRDNQQLEPGFFYFETLVAGMVGIVRFNINKYD